MSVGKHFCGVFSSFFYSLINKAKDAQKTIVISARTRYARSCGSEVVDSKTAPFSKTHTEFVVSVLTVYYEYLGRLHISQTAKSAALRKVQWEQVQRAWSGGGFVMGSVPTPIPPLASAVAEGNVLELLPKDEGCGGRDDGEVTDMSCSTVAQCSDWAHSNAFCLSLLRIASSSGNM